MDCLHYKEGNGRYDSISLFFKTAFLAEEKQLDSREGTLVDEATIVGFSLFTLEKVISDTG